MSNPSETTPPSKAVSQTLDPAVGKKPYRRPVFTRLGTLQDLTLHNSGSHATDNPSGKSHTS